MFCSFIAAPVPSPLCGSLQPAAAGLSEPTRGQRRQYVLPGPLQPLRRRAAGTGRGQRAGGRQAVRRQIQACLLTR